MSSPRRSPRHPLRTARRALGWALFLGFCTVKLPAPDERVPHRMAPAGAPIGEMLGEGVADSPIRILTAEPPAPTTPQVTVGPVWAASLQAATPPTPVSAPATQDPPDSAGHASAVPAPAPAVSSVLPGAGSVPSVSPFGEMQEGMFELVVDGTGERTLIAVLVDAEGEVFLPLVDLLEHTEIPFTITVDGFRLEWPRDVWRTDIDRSAGTVRVGDGEPWSLGTGLHDRDGALYLTAPATASLLGVPVRVVWSDLVVHVAGEDLPVAVRRRRELERRIYGSAASRFGPDPLDGVPFEARTGGLAASWGLNAFAGEGLDTHGSARVSVGGSLWGGATDVSATTTFADGARAEIEDLSARYSRPFFGSEWIGRLDLGAVTTGGVVPRRVVGGAISNDPYIKPRYFGTSAVTPVVPSGWDYEVYQGNHLVGTSDVVGQEELTAEVSYGHTPVRVRMLGPAGQEVVQELLFVVNPEQVPAGALRYDLSAGACRDTWCDNHAAAEVRLGVDHRLTLGAGAERIDPGAGAAELGYHVSAVARLKPNLSTDVRVSPGSFLQAGAQFAPSRSTNATASYIWQSEDERFGGSEGWQARLALSGSLPLGETRRHASASLFLRGVEQGRVEAWRAGLSTSVGRSFVSADLERGLQASSMVTLSTYTPIGDVSSRLRDLAVNAALAMSARRAESLEAGLSFRPTPASTLQAGVRFRQHEAPRFTLSFSTRTAKAFAQARATASETQGHASVSLDGGAVLGGNAGASFFALPGTGQAGVRGRVFVDANGNGVRDSGEPPAVSVPVSVGGYRVTTDTEGAFESWGLRPYEAVAVHVDSLSLDFDLRPATTETVVRPSPNAFHTVDIPLLRTRELTGWVVGPEGRPLGGVGVEVVDEHGTVVASGRTFSDGEVYLERVPVGAFRLRVSERSLIALRAGAEEITVTVSAHADGAVAVPTLEVRFHR